MPTIAEQVIDILERELGQSRADIIAPQATLNGLGTDSIDVIEIALEIEKQFDIDVSDEEIEKWKTPSDIIVMCERAVAKRP